MTGSTSESHHAILPPFFDQIEGAQLQRARLSLRPNALPAQELFERYYVSNFL
jgi:hypothetical protein